MQPLPPDLALVLLSALVNAAVTWGVVSTKIAWLRRDVDLAHERIDRIEAEARHSK